MNPLRFKPALIVCFLSSSCLAFGCGDADGELGLSAESDVIDVSVNEDASSNSADGLISGDAADSVDDSDEPTDITVVTEIQEDVDLSDWYQDTSDEDAGPEETVSEEVMEPSEDDTVSGDAVEDAAGPEEDGDASEQAEGDTASAEVPEEDVSMDDTADDDGADDASDEDDEGIFEDCGALGVAAQWEGTFEGEVETHIEENLAQTLNLLADALLPVSGELSFSISCVDSKLIVTGDMLGAATVAGQGDFPFELALFGYYNPETQTMDADIINGMVLLYGLAEVYFVGSFDGDLVADLGQGGEVFTGQWEGIYNGTNFPLPPGSEDDVDASGSGTWSAAPADETDTD